MLTTSDNFLDIFINYDAVFIPTSNSKNKYKEAILHPSLAYLSLYFPNFKIKANKFKTHINYIDTWYSIPFYTYIHKPLTIGSDSKKMPMLYSSTFTKTWMLMPDPRVIKETNSKLLKLIEEKGWNSVLILPLNSELSENEFHRAFSDLVNNDKVTLMV